MHPIGKNIKILRQMQGITQTRLAESVGVAPAYISQIESMIRVPSVKVTHRIAEALGTTVGTLLGAAFGIWLDNNHPRSHSWTLILLVMGLVIGCLNAWHWVAKEDKEMREEQEDNNA